MKLLICFVMLIFSWLFMPAYAGDELGIYNEGQILNALQKRVMLFDPDSVYYSSKEDKEMVAAFLEDNKKLFDSLGEREPFYYIKLINLNEYPNLARSFALRARHTYVTHYDEYDSDDRKILKRAMSEYRMKGYFPAVIEKIMPEKSE